MGQDFRQSKTSTVNGTRFLRIIHRPRRRSSLSFKEFCFCRVVHVPLRNLGVGTPVDRGSSIVNSHKERRKPPYLPIRNHTKTPINGVSNLSSGCQNVSSRHFPCTEINDFDRHPFVTLMWKHLVKLWNPTPVSRCLFLYTVPSTRSQHVLSSWQTERGYGWYSIQDGPRSPSTAELTSTRYLIGRLR